MKEILRAYFEAWITGDAECVKRTFAENVVYTECYGPHYIGIGQVLQWFADWNRKGRVIRWDIARTLQHKDTIVAEWTFACEYEGKQEAFDGVTIADFDQNKIVRLREFQSKAEHYYPYEQK